MAREQREEDTMVLRTVYLPESLDNQAKRLAFDRGISKGALIREACTRMYMPRSRISRGDHPL
jgi:hypothetical protein